MHTSVISSDDLYNIYGLINILMYEIVKAPPPLRIYCYCFLQWSREKIHISLITIFLYAPTPSISEETCDARQDWFLFFSPRWGRNQLTWFETVFASVHFPTRAASWDACEILASSSHPPAFRAPVVSLWDHTFLTVSRRQEEVLTHTHTVSHFDKHTLAHVRLNLAEVDESIKTCVSEWGVCIPLFTPPQKKKHTPTAPMEESIAPGSWNVLFVHPVFIGPVGICVCVCVCVGRWVCVKKAVQGCWSCLMWSIV